MNLVGKEFSNFFHFGLDDCAAVPRIFIFVRSIKILVFYPRRIKGFRRLDGRHNGCFKYFTLFKLFDGFLRQTFLIFIVIENNGPVLGSNIITLAVDRCWVMALPEGL